jgi:Cu+-exporting ATPase
MKDKITIQIQGMSCASCVGRIEKKLVASSGIISVNVNLATETGVIEYSSKILTPKKIINLIESAGYQAHLIEEKSLRDINLVDIPLMEKTTLLFSILLTLPLLIPMFIQPFGLHLMPNPMLQLVLAIPVQFIFGRRFYYSAWKAVLNKSGNMDLLVAIGTSAAFGMSLYLLIKNDFHQNTHLYFESSSTIITFVLIGKYLEKKAKMKTVDAIKSLQNIRPEMARVIINESEFLLPIDEIQIDQVVLIKPGELIPVDGIIVKGLTSVDESLITGESLPVRKEVRGKVITGSLNGDGAIYVKVAAVGGDTLLSKIVLSIQEAQSKKAPIQKLVDKVSFYFVPFVIAISFFTLILTGIFTQNWEVALVHAISVLVVACPCALGLATPTSIMVGTGVAARSGILIRDAEAIELAQAVQVVCFDKTGTLTEGQPSVVKIICSDLSENDFLSLVCSLQSESEHPLAKAILKEGLRRDIKFERPESSKVFPGIGIEGIINGRKLLLGSQRILHSLNIHPELQEEIFRLHDTDFKGGTVSFLIDVQEEKLLGAVIFQDQLRCSAKTTVEELKRLGIRTIILTGDNSSSAFKIANELGVDEVRSELLPQEKSQFIEDLKKSGLKVAMVGDGINDAPALAAADVGIAMASGVEAAMNTAGLTLMRSEPLLILDAISVSNKTYSKIKQNLFWAFIFNILGIPLAAFGLITPQLAGLAMALSSVSVVTNSLMLNRWKSGVR